MNSEQYDGNQAWYYYYGLAASSQGRVEKAAELYSKAIEANPADFQVPMFLAMAYTTLGRKQDEMRVGLGARHARTALKLNPHDTRAIYFAAQNLYRIGEKDKAIALAEQAMQQGMNEPVVLLGWGDRAWMENDSDLEPLREEPRFRALLARIH